MLDGLAFDSLDDMAQFVAGLQGRVGDLEAAIREHQRDNAYVTAADELLYVALKGQDLDP